MQNYKHVDLHSDIDLSVFRKIQTCKMYEKIFIDKPRNECHIKILNKIKTCLLFDDIWPFLKL